MIELLIVVAIIGILAAIAIPNFLEAQVRAKVARAREEFHTLATALEVYCVDQGAYVNAIDPVTAWYIDPAQVRLAKLTTPVEYLTSVPWEDPFEPEGPPTQVQEGYQYQNYDDMKVYDGVAQWIFSLRGYPAWTLASRGPDGLWPWAVLWGGFPGVTTWEDAIVDYDATNGTVSLGDVRRDSSARAVP